MNLRCNQSHDKYQIKGIATYAECHFDIQKIIKVCNLGTFNQKNQWIVYHCDCDFFTMKSST